MFWFSFSFRHIFTFSQILKQFKLGKIKQIFRHQGKIFIKDKSMKLLINNKIIHVNDSIMELIFPSRENIILFLTSIHQLKHFNYKYQVKSLLSVGNDVYSTSLILVFLSALLNNKIIELGESKIFCILNKTCLYN